jgi:drug/metabolite transporter (DMT)-like permease
MSNLQLFAGCVAIWSTTWIAITFQLGKVAPEASVFYRFALASLVLFAWCAWRRLPLRFPPRTHAWLVLFGVLTFSVNYMCVYYAEETVVSGLVAVGSSATPLLAMLGMRVFFGAPMAGRVALASALGILGVVLVFVPEVQRAPSWAGVAFIAGGVLCATLGGMVAHRNQEARLPLWQTMAWGMLYGSLTTLAFTLAGGKGLTFDASVTYVASLAYLVAFGSILAFAGWLTLLQRIGAARAGYIGVMVPVVALLISAAFEGFRFHWLTLAGIAITLAGNVIVLGKSR